MIMMIINLYGGTGVLQMIIKTPMAPPSALIWSTLTHRVSRASSKTWFNWELRRADLDIASSRLKRPGFTKIFDCWWPTGPGVSWVIIQDMVVCRVGAPIGQRASGLPPKKESISSVSLHTGSDLSFPPELSSESCLNFCLDWTLPLPSRVKLRELGLGSLPGLRQFSGDL